MKLPIDPKKVNVPKPVVSKLASGHNSAFTRFPLLFTLLGALGVVATFYGFERLIDKIDLLADNPFILLASGVLILIFTGSLYKKL